MICVAIGISSRTLLSFCRVNAFFSRILEVVVKIAFIGLGNMGGGIAKNIHDAGFDLTVWNRTRSKMGRLLDSGAKGAETAAEAVGDADLVVTCLMDDSSIEQLLVGEGAVLNAMQPGAIHLCVTTISPRFASFLKDLHERHDTQYISGPVVGRPDAAEHGSLMTLLAGDADAVAKIRPVCEAYCNEVVVVSEEPHAANVMKLAMNYMAIASIEAMSEVYALVEANGVDAGLLAGFFATKFYAHPALKMYAQKIQTRDFQGDAGFAMSGGLKDVRLMIEAAKDKGVDLDFAKIIEGKMMEAINKGMAGKDWSAIYEVTRDRAGMK